MLPGLALGGLLFAIGLGGLWQAWDSRSRWAEWDEEALTVHKSKGPARTYKWTDLSSLGYIAWMQAQEIKFNDGYKFLFFDMMTGSKELLEACNGQLLNRTDR